MLVGYVRVSTEEQSLNRQIDMLVDYGVDKRNIYQEKISGMKYNREQLDKMINELQEGDTIIIVDLTRISRSTKDLLSIIDRIKAKGASIKSIKDTWLDTSSDNPYNSFLLTVMSGLSQLERDLISQRTKEGLRSAKTRGRNGGRPSKRNDKADTVGLLYREGYKIVDIGVASGKCGFHTLRAFSPLIPMVCRLFRNYFYTLSIIYNMLFSLILKSPSPLYYL